MVDEHLARIRELLDGHSTVTLATTVAGEPWAATVFYASDAAINLYFVSDGRTRHGRELAQDARVAAAINRDVATWDEVIGLQLTGEARVVKGGERDQALAAYLKKFPDVARLFDDPRDENEKLIASRLQRTPFWRLTPAWIRLIDSSRGFGWKWETTLAGPAAG